MATIRLHLHNVQRWSVH